MSSCPSSQDFPMLHYRLCFLQCDWRREISIRKVINVNETRGISRMSPDPLSWVGSGNETSTRQSVIHIVMTRTLPGMLSNCFRVDAICINFAKWELESCSQEWSDVVIGFLFSFSLLGRLLVTIFTCKAFCSHFAKSLQTAATVPLNWIHLKQLV